MFHTYWLVIDVLRLGLPYEGKSEPLEDLVFTGRLLRPIAIQDKIQMYLCKGPFDVTSQKGLNIWHGYNFGESDS